MSIAPDHEHQRSSRAVGRLAGKVVIITGSASGQGKAAAKLFAREGAVVVVADFNEAAGKAVADQINNTGGTAVFHYVDLTDESLVEALVQFTVERYDRIDVMYNNAGMVKMRPIGDLTTDEWKFTLKFELDHVYFGSKYALRIMEAQGSGVILNTASTSGLVGIPGHGPHAATKAGVIGLTRSIAVDYGHKGIRCNAIAPGFIPFTLQTTEFSNEPFIDLMLNMQSIKRAGTPDDVAHCALFLASDESSWITGQTIAVDGGHTAR